MSERLMLDSLDTIEELATSGRPLYVRYSEGCESDTQGGSIDFESGLKLPGLAVNPLTPEDWWTRPLGDWLARQLCQYKHLQEKNPDRFAWILTGEQVGRGPDCEPLLVEVEPIARLSPRLLDEAEKRYRRNFDAEKGPEDSEPA